MNENTLENPNWIGTLTSRNVQEVVARLLRLLDGKHYTRSVKANMADVSEKEVLAFEPDMREGQELKPIDGEPIRVYFNKGVPTGFTLTDTFGTWSCSTKLEDGDDPELKNPLFTFTKDGVTITRRMDNGSVFFWSFVIEND